MVWFKQKDEEEGVKLEDYWKIVFYKSFILLACFPA